MVLQVLEDLVAYIDAQTALTTGTNLFRGFMDRPTADPRVCVLERQGGTVYETNVERYAVQLFAQGTHYTNTKALMNTVLDKLLNKAGITQGSTVFQSIQGSRPGYIGKNASGEHEFSANLTIYTG